VQCRVLCGLCPAGLVVILWMGQVHEQMKNTQKTEKEKKKRKSWKDVLQRTCHPHKRCTGYPSRHSPIYVTVSPKQASVEGTIWGAANADDPKALVPNDRPPRPPSPIPLSTPPPLIPEPPIPPNIDTRSSSGLLDVPARRLAAAGVEDKTSVAPSSEGCPSGDGASSKSKRFSAC